MNKKETGTAFLIAVVLAGVVYYATNNWIFAALIFFCVVGGEIAFINKFIKRVDEQK